MADWFARVDLNDASAAERRVVSAIVELLDQLVPARLDRSRQVIEPEEGETWVRLRHDADPAMSIDVALSDGTVHFYGVMGHDEAYGSTWDTDAIQTLAELLMSEYTFEEYRIRGRRWREVTIISGPYDVEIAGTGFLAVLPMRRWATLAEKRLASFECGGSHQALTDG